MAALHILVLGGSGRTGRILIDDALERGYTVTALVRNPDSLKPATKANANFTLVKGGLNQASIDRAMETPHIPSAVLVALGAPLASGNPFSAVVTPAYMMAHAHDVLIRSMEQHDVRRLITMSAFGTAESWPNLSMPMRLILGYSNMRYQFKDHTEVDKRVKAAAKDGRIQHTMLRPVLLADGPAAQPSEVKDHGDDGSVAAPGMMAKISRRTVISIMLDAVVVDTWVGRTPVISGLSASA